MATKTPEENPVIGDMVLLNLSTPDIEGCNTSDPYKLETVMVYFVERNYTGGKFQEYKNTSFESDSLTKFQEAKKTACENPTEANIANANLLQEEANSKSKSDSFYYDEAVPIKILGNNSYPAWLSTDTENALVQKYDEDDDGNTVYGQFYYELDTVGLQEGDYFVCWTWQSLIAGDSLSNSFKFHIDGNTKLFTSLPTHETSEEKYQVLLERYLPETFKTKICNDDKTPEILEKFNNSCASFWKFLEDQSNQLLDLLDANVVREQFLPILGNYLGVRLKTQDPTLWRRQIKNAIQLYKKKGTKNGLAEALDQAGIKMNNLSRLWQIISPYTWQESFVYEGSNSFVLEKTSFTINFENFQLWLRRAEEDSYEELSLDYIQITTEDGISTLTWNGSNLSVNVIDLEEGDIVRILYQYEEISTEEEQLIENYIRQLSLADTRDERDQLYPLKNWNVRVIEEEDSLFDLIISNKHPYKKDVIFGKIRTEFAYSENIYNMEEWNGSLRDSKNPCDIDKMFVDSCGACLGSKFNVDLEIENLSNDRVLEAQDVIKEFVPFHAVLHSMNFSGAFNDFVEPPVEEVEILITFSLSDYVISGQAQMWFNRAMKKGTTTNQILRDQLALSTLEHEDSGIVYNDDITIYSSEVEFNRIGMSNNAVLEILAPSPNAGIKYLTSPTKHTAVVDSASEPLNTSAFTFRVSNTVLDGSTLCNITQDNIFKFYDSSKNFTEFSIQSLWDVDNNDAIGAWKVKIPTYSATPFDILDILPDGSLLLLNDGSLPSSNDSDLTYQLLDYNSLEIDSGDAGILQVKNRAKVEVLDVSLTDVHNLIGKNYYFEYSGTQYLITGVLNDSDNEFYIDNYSSGDVGGAALTVYQRLAENVVGNLSHRGLKLKMVGDLETSLSIQNGVNATPENTWDEGNNFKEEFLIFIDDNVFFMEEIDGDDGSGNSIITLAGPDEYWKTLGSGGTNKAVVQIYKYKKQEITIPGQQFDLPEHTFRNYDTEGREVIKYTNDNTGEVTGLSVENNDSEDYFLDQINQNESISYSIDYSNGFKQSGSV